MSNMEILMYQMWELYCAKCGSFNVSNVEFGVKLALMKKFM